MKRILCLAMVLVMAFGLLSCGGDPDPDGIHTKGEGVMTYAEYAAAPLDSQVVVETFIQAKQGWWDNKATFYTQDRDGAYFLYNMPCSQEEYNRLTVGTKIRVTGYKDEWSGEVEIIDATFEILSGTWVASASDLTAKLGTDELINYQNSFASFKGMTVVASTDADGNEAPFLYNWDGSGSADSDSDLYFQASYNGKVYTFVVEYYLCGPGSQAYEAVKGLQIGDEINLEGFLYWYNGPQAHVTLVEVK